MESSCYIIASPSININPITQLLKDKGVTTVVDESLLSYKHTLSNEIRRRIKNASFVIAILAPQIDYAGTFFEIGIAYALKKQIILVILPGAEIADWNISGVEVIKVDLDNLEKLDYLFEKIMADLDRPKYRQEEKGTRGLKAKPLGSIAKIFSNKVEQLGDNATELQVLDLLLSAFKESGISIFARTESRESKADLALWSDELSPYVGNPLLVEVKLNIRRTTQIQKVVEQLSKYVTGDRAATLLLVYLNGNKKILNEAIRGHPRILNISLQDLFERLENESFTDIIRDLRNRQVHQAGG